MTNEQYAHDMHELRREASAEINRLIRFLDDIGGDPDLEPDDDNEDGGDNEPSLGWTATFNQASRQRLGSGDDLELDTADLELEPDLEQEHNN